MAKHIKKKHRLDETYIKNSSEDMFSGKIRLRPRFYIADFGPFGWGKTRSKLGRKNHDEKSMDFANVFYMFFLMIAL